MSSKIKIIRPKCDPSLAQDTSLPCTAYLVEYMEEGQVFFDIVLCSKKVDIFDHYWDNYKEGFITFKQTEGRANPKIWEDPQNKKQKK